MRALQCNSVGNLDDLKIVDVPAPDIKPHQVLIRVQACGLNYPDVLMVQGKYQRKPPVPFSPGCEISGVVQRVGDAVTELAAGQRVCGAIPFGGLAESLAVDAGDLYPLPETADLDAAAALLYTYSTALYALRERAQMTAGESLLVLGAGGGVGIAAVELGTVLGARVTAAASSESKLALARSKGAERTLRYALDLSDAAPQKAFGAQLKELAGGGFNVICDPVGGDYAEPALRSIAWGGRHLVIGFAAGGIPRIAMNLPLLKGCQIVGVSWGGAMANDPALKRGIHRELVAMFADGKLTPPIAARFSLNDGIEALKMLSERRALGKVVVHC